MADRPAVEHYAPDRATAVVGGEVVPCVYFFGGPLSNFVGQPISVTSEQPWSSHTVTSVYTTVEHFFQACKARDAQSHAQIRKASSPGLAKMIGRQVPLREDWEGKKYEYMLTGLREKFQDPHYRTILSNTVGYHIAEDSPTDDEWGIRDKGGGFGGKNLLGKALMEIRYEIRKGA